MSRIPLSTCLRVAALASLLALPAAHAGVVASYSFQNTLAADQSGAPALVAINPLGQNGFETALVNGQQRTVYRWSGVGDPVTSQAGLQLDASALADPSRYSVSMTFEFATEARSGGGWRRVVDTEGRQSDNGLYVGPSNVMEVVQGTEDNTDHIDSGSTLFTTPGFHDLLLDVSPGAVAGTQLVAVWLDGVLELTATTERFALDNVNNPKGFLYLFADNLGGGANLEYANGRIAQLTLSQPGGTSVPEPAMLSLVALSLLGLAAGRRRRRIPS